MKKVKIIADSCSDVPAELLEKYDIDSVIHFAGLKAVGESVAKPLEYYENNLCATMTLCRIMGKHNIKKLI